jgi:hypothetical protein
MNKAASLSLAASLALVVIPAGTATASETNAQTLRKNVAIKRILISQPGSDRMLNPQPLPPKAKFGQTVKFSDPLNPQPLPPKEKFGQIVKYSDPLNPQPLPPKERMTRSFINNVNIRALNPQPLPPKAGQIVKFSDPLNPQPLPPKEKFNVAFKDANVSAFKSAYNIRALNPQPLPPKAGQMVVR